MSRRTAHGSRRTARSSRRTAPDAQQQTHSSQLQTHSSRRTATDAQLAAPDAQLTAPDAQLTAHRDILVSISDWSLRYAERCAMQPADEHQQPLLLKLLLEKPGNGKCVDCGAADPTWASYTLGVFICQSCSGLHRNITYISKVKSVLLDPWSDAEVEFMASTGNDQAKAKYEEKAKEPKAAVKVDSLNATFQPTKIGNAHGLQITFLTDNSTRNLFVYHADGKEMVDWFNAIRAARYHYLQVAYPGALDTDLVPQLTRNYVKEGLMQKTGPKHTEGFKKRWFTLDDRRLMYFRDALDASARGELFLGSEADGYGVTAGPGAPVQGHHTWPFVITVVTPDRTYLFACETQEEQRDWLAAFHRAVRRPILPQEYAVEARFKHKS
ncbi:hypothetical protein CRUP_022921 [Coryphaenoides rupestris]|nr:hypothetical protein CRUP_022921 [Coryphaenoides rupestris]